MELFNRLEYCLSLVIGYTLSAAYGIWFLYFLIVRFMKNMSTPFWTVKKRELPPQCLNDPALGNHVYVQLKNLKLHYVEAGDRGKPLMLFLHGFPEFWYSWRHQIKEFSSDYWVVAVDMRGFGESEKPPGRGQYKLELLIADIKNLIVALGKEHCTLVAHDWGGVIAWCLVMFEPQMFDSYIIMNSIQPEAFHEHIKTSFSQIKRSWYVFFFQLPWLPELLLSMDDLQFISELITSGSVKSPSNISDEDIEAFKFYLGKPGALTGPINYYRANFLLKVTRNQLHDLGKNPDFPPGLIIFGDRDNYIDKEIQDLTLKLVANTTLKYIKDANHFVQQDDPISVNREMRNFLNNLKTPGES